MIAAGVLNKPARTFRSPESGQLKGYQVGFYYFERFEEGPKLGGKVRETHVSHEKIVKMQDIGWSHG